MRVALAASSGADYLLRMAVTVLHTGQSGVERGADRAARALGFPVGGYCSFERRDELGRLPDEISQDLVACTARGSRNAMRATLASASALVIAVPDTCDIAANAGLDPLRRQARKADIPVWIVDPRSNLEELSSSLGRLGRETDLRLMITGPRHTRWPEGERLGWRIVGELSMQPRSQQRRILVVEDHQETAQVACDFLHDLGHTCVSAGTGEEGLQLATEFDPDVVFMDIDLPDLDGYQVARRMRGVRRRPLFLAAITGWENAMDASLAFDAGFDRHVVKPATGATFCQLLSEAAVVLP
jgi:CheY-like chemotaxis protein